MMTQLKDFHHNWEKSHLLYSMVFITKWGIMLFVVSFCIIKGLALNSRLFGYSRPPSIELEAPVVALGAPCSTRQFTKILFFLYFKYI